MSALEFAPLTNERKELAMQNHRFKHILEASQLFQRESEPQLAPAGFIMCPLMGTPQAAYQAALYQQAMEHARQMARPSIVELDLLGVWN
jgi:hypothetical protein